MWRPCTVVGSQINWGTPIAVNMWRRRLSKVTSSYVQSTAVYQKFSETQQIFPANQVLLVSPGSSWTMTLVSNLTIRCPPIPFSCPLGHYLCPRMWGSQGGWPLYWADVAINIPPHKNLPWSRTAKELRKNCTLQEFIGFFLLPVNAKLTIGKLIPYWGLIIVTWSLLQNVFRILWNLSKLWYWSQFVLLSECVSKKEESGEGQCHITRSAGGPCRTHLSWTHGEEEHDLHRKHLDKKDCDNFHNGYDQLP